ncbi:MAG: metalloregulator ArsR/SmtB family transcription factor [Desulfuromonadales bacterium]|nr:metalloregulator ArsR/SmtB family transcription factor [Desulfuromonadales bacterium]
MTSEDLCQVACINQERVDRVRRLMPDGARLEETAAIFKVLGDATRMRLLCALLDEELCVCDLAASIEASPSAVSHQLRLLRTARLVRSRREGKMIYYRLDDDHVRHLLREGLVHAAED